MGVSLKTFLKGYPLNRKGGRTDHLHLASLRSYQNSRIGIAVDHAILKNQPIEITRHKQRNLLAAFPTGDVHVLEVTGDPLVFIGPDHARLIQSLHRAVFIGNLSQRTVTAPLSC